MSKAHVQIRTQEFYDSLPVAKIMNYYTVYRLHMTNTDLRGLNPAITVKDLFDYVHDNISFEDQNQYGLKN